MKNLTLVLLVTLLFSVLTLKLSIGAESCYTLFADRCDTKCHNITRICQKLGKKSKWSWYTSVKMMIKRGAKLNREERKSLVACLVDQDRKIVERCEDFLSGTAE